MTETNQTSFLPLVFEEAISKVSLVWLDSKLLSSFPPFTHFFLLLSESAIRLLLKLCGDYMKLRILQECLTQIVYSISYHMFVFTPPWTIYLPSCFSFRNQIMINLPSLLLCPFAGDCSTPLKAASWCCTVWDSHSSTGGCGINLAPPFYQNPF